jgi:hypothetical protein
LRLVSAMTALSMALLILQYLLTVNLSHDGPFNGPLRQYFIVSIQTKCSAGAHSKRLLDKASTYKTYIQYTKRLRHKTSP